MSPLHPLMSKGVIHSFILTPWSVPRRQKQVGDCNSPLFSITSDVDKAKDGRPSFSARGAKKKDRNCFSPVMVDREVGGTQRVLNNGSCS